jgi:quercetin dioxygenase-like cupin family protein
MKIIRKSDIDKKDRADGRKVCYYPPFDIPSGTDKIGLITVDTPKDCLEEEHQHPVSTEIFYHLTPGKVEINGAVYDLKAGDIVVLEPGDTHKQIADEDIKIVALRIPLSSDKEYARGKKNGNN